MGTSTFISGVILWISNSQTISGVSFDLIDHVSDDEIVAAWRELAALEGVFCEPASAAGIAGIRKLAREGRADADGCYVAVLTGHGLKDPQLAVEQFAVPAPIPAELAAMERALGWG